MNKQSWIALVYKMNIENLDVATSELIAIESTYFVIDEKHCIVRTDDFEALMTSKDGTKIDSCEEISSDLSRVLKGLS